MQNTGRKVLNHVVGFQKKKKLAELDAKTLQLKLIFQQVAGGMERKVPTARDNSC